MSDKKPREFWIVDGRAVISESIKKPIEAEVIGGVHVIEYSAYETLEKLQERTMQIAEFNETKRQEYVKKVEAEIARLEADLSVIKTSCTMFASKCEALEAERNEKAVTIEHMLQYETKLKGICDKQVECIAELHKTGDELKAELERVLTKLASKHTKMMDIALHADKLAAALAKHYHGQLPPSHCTECRLLAEHKKLKGDKNATTVG